jgi:hypothetical protein
MNLLEYSACIASRKIGAKHAASIQAHPIVRIEQVVLRYLYYQWQEFND